MEEIGVGPSEAVRSNINTPSLKHPCESAFPPLDFKRGVAA